MEKIEVLVIGAGVVGLAIARELARNDKEVIVAEREAMAGSITSARNSGVIHAGIYYHENSLKARFCVQGKEKLYAYAKERNIPYKQCQKIMVACEADEIAKLESIKQKAYKNGVTDLKVLDQDALKTMEPELAGVGGLLSPSTGIIDIHALMESLIADIEDHSGVIAYENEISTAKVTDDGAIITMNSGETLLVKTLINAAGLGAQDIASKIEGLDQTTIPKLHRAKGNYFSVSGKAPFSRLIYPIPVAGGLGAHYTMNIGGDNLFGPDVEWLNDNEEPNYNVDEARVESFYTAVKRYWPGVTDKELMPSYSGIRPKITGKGEPDGDFTIHGEDIHGAKGVINLYGIESPGLTSSMAIAEYISEYL